MPYVFSPPLAGFQVRFGFLVPFNRYFGPVFIINFEDIIPCSNQKFDKKSPEWSAVKVVLVRSNGTVCS